MIKRKSATWLQSPWVSLLSQGQGVWTTWPWLLHDHRTQIYSEAKVIAFFVSPVVVTACRLILQCHTISGRLEDLGLSDHVRAFMADRNAWRVHGDPFKHTRFSFFSVWCGHFSSECPSLLSECRWTWNGIDVICFFEIAMLHAAFLALQDCQLIHKKMSLIKSGLKV